MGKKFQTYMTFRKVSFLVLISLIFLSCTEEPPKSEFDMLRDYCVSAHEEFIEKYNTQREIEDAELLMFGDNFEPFKDILPMSLMGSAKLIDTMINGGDCFTKFDWSEELEWKIDDYIYYGGSCEALMQYLNVTFLDSCEQDWNPRYAPRLPIIFNNGKRLDYEKHYQEFVEYGNLAGYKLFLQLDIATTTSPPETTTTTSPPETTTTTRPPETTTTTVRDNPPYWENNLVELIEITYSQRNCYAWGKFQFSNIYDERPVSLFFDIPDRINVRLSEGSGDLTKNEKGWTIVVPMGGPPGPEITIYAIDDMGQYSEYLRFKVPDSGYDCPYDD